MTTCVTEPKKVSGEFITINDERFYAIRNTDQMAPFFISVVSDSDHWLFVSSNGGLTAGRVSPETALFPYEPVDKIYDSTSHTGCKTLLRVTKSGEQYNWEPFNQEHNDRYAIERNLYKNTLGNKLCFEEVNQELQLTFRYTWATSEEYGFARSCELINNAGDAVSVELIDGLQNVLPAGTPRFTQTNSSNLVDAYKWTELNENTGVAMFTLFSAITDRAEPCESLKANTIFTLGLDDAKVLLSTEQLTNFRQKAPIAQEANKRGIRGAYLLNAQVELAADSSKEWQFVANLEQNQSQIAALIAELSEPAAVKAKLAADVEKGSDALARIMASADGFQATNEENVSVHHYANVLFNVLRGGIFDTQYDISAADFTKTIKMFNNVVFERNQALLSELPEEVNFSELLNKVKAAGDAQLERLTLEYLPITFGRRHGDPSRPWNQFAIKLKDEQGDRLLSYQGNWRDIFQNWEALTFSYPEFVENVIAKFVNASTVDGYNPYRITKEGIDWEVEEPDDPWSYIGYWGDHQIIYLLKLLEQSKKFHPEKLSELLNKPVFCYANVPYRIKGFDDIVKNAKDTVTFDNELAELIDERVASLGSDGKLVLDSKGEVYQANLLEKLLVPLLSKLSNLVIDGGIWLNTQRPEWNDANNALVGQGLSMVTLYYIRRYITFMQELLANESATTEVSAEVAEWLTKTAEILAKASAQLTDAETTDGFRYDVLKELGEAGADYRQTLYKNLCFANKSTLDLTSVKALLADAQVAIDHTIATNETEEGLYHAYNLLGIDDSEANVENLYAMLEGQVAALSSGAMAPAKAADVLENLFASTVYREDQKTFMLYPDRDQANFQARNTIPATQVEAIATLVDMVKAADARLIEKDVAGEYRFNAEMQNVGALNDKIDALSAEYPGLEAAREALQTMYEQVFNHKAFTGRSGGMFGFEGLGSIYWHMVSKLLFVTMENFELAVEQGADEATIKRLGDLYYKVRLGIGFNKTPEEYGAFPCDPYSHTPKHAGAQQPGMTGQVKEEVLTRFGELGVKVADGKVSFNPALLRSCEFTTEASSLHFLDVAGEWKDLAIGANELAFTWCQVPVVYELTDAAPSVTLTYNDGSTETLTELALSAEQSQELFLRSGKIQKLELSLNKSMLLS